MLAITAHLCPSHPPIHSPSRLIHLIEEPQVHSHSPCSTLNLVYDQNLCSIFVSPSHVTLHNNNNQSEGSLTNQSHSQTSNRIPSNSNDKTPLIPPTAPPLAPTWVAAALLFPWLATALLLLLLPRSLEAGARWCEVTWRPAAGLRGPAPALHCQLRPIDSLPHHTRPLRLSPTILTKMYST